MKAYRLIGIYVAVIVGVATVWSVRALGQQSSQSQLSAAGKATSDSKAKQEIRDAQNEVQAFVDAFVKATNARDAAALGDLLSDDFVFTGPTGKAQNKQQLINLAMTVGYESFPYRCDGDDKEEDCYTISVSVDPNRPGRKTAVVMGRSTVTGTVNGKDITAHYQGMQMLVRQTSGKWIAVAGTMTQVTPTASTAKH